MRTLARGESGNRRPILITGGCGFIGSNLAHTLALQGRPVLVLDSLAREGVCENAQWLWDRHADLIEIRRGDIRNPDIVKTCVASVSAVLHLAGQVAVTTSVDNPIDDFEINARGALNVLEAIRTLNPDAPVLFASTNKVYGQVLSHGEVRRDGEHYTPSSAVHARGVDEQAPLDFHSPYGCSKGAADQYVHDYARVFGLRTAVLRMSCIYGPRQFGTEDQGWIAHFMLQALRGLPITVYGDGYQVRDALHVDDAVSAWISVLDNIDAARGRVFNLGGGPANAISVRELLRLMRQIGRVPSDIRHRNWRPGDQPWYVSDTTALQQVLEWEARVPFRAGLRSLDNWLSSRFGRREPQLTAVAGGWR
jgi:CDP-paratose 2-epimerase